MHNDFFRAASCSPKVTVADVDANVGAILEMLDQCSRAHADMVVFPEMCVTAYTCADLFHNSTLLEGAVKGLGRLVAGCPANLPLVFVGMPVVHEGVLYNCAVAIARGQVLGIVPKSYLPSYNEFYERRWFTPAPQGTYKINIGGFHDVPFSTSLIFDVDGVKVGAEICEDLWVTIPPSSILALNGAEIIANLSASDDVIGKYSYLRQLVAQQSARCICGYVYSSAGYGESSTDLVFRGKNLICENGHFLSENDRRTLALNGSCAIADIDIAAIRRDRLHLGTFADCIADHPITTAVVITPRRESAGDERQLLRTVDPLPFVPHDTGRLAERCEEIIQIQTAGLCKRLEATSCRCLVIGISGGLDSTLALLVATRAFDALGIDRKGIIGITMPGFGTTGRTHSNAVALMDALGVTSREIPIADAVNLHFRDIAHDPAVHDVTYENSQARERTQILMDVANQAGGMVLGTGDLSELALGWATYNGDHMSMYAVNAGVPKTLVRHLVKYFATELADSAGRAALLDIVDTPISPELLPADADGNIAQKTEDLVGPYELHDFFLYYMLRYGFSPRRIFYLALHAFDGTYDRDTIRHWLKTFFRRFFSQQFKRSCLPDGPKVGSVTLSPRGDWRMPSDASSALWRKEAEEI